MPGMRQYIQAEEEPLQAHESSALDKLRDQVAQEEK